MIAGEGIQEAKEIIADGGVDDLIYPREWIRILGIGFVETCEVHAEAPTTISFWDDHRFAIQVGWATSRINFAFFSFSISWTMKSCFSCACFLVFYFTGCACGHMARWCSITSLGTPVISDGVQANMLEFARRKVTSALSYLGESPARW
jgi:hypothetical protein